MILFMYSKWQYRFVGLVAGLFSAMLMLLLYFGMGLFSNNYFSVYYFLVYLFPLASFSLASIFLRNRYNNGALPFGKSFKLSLLTGIVISIVFSAGMYLCIKYLSQPSFGMRASQVEADVLLRGRVLSLEEISQKKEMVSQMNSPLSVSVMYFILNLILTPVFAFIIAIFAWRKNRIID